MEKFHYTINKELKYRAMEENEIDLEKLKDFEDYGMRIREYPAYQNEFKSKFGRDLDEDKDMVLIGEYGGITFDLEGNWVKFDLVGEDIGDGDFYFFIKGNNIYLDKGSMLLDESYRDMVITTLDQVIGPSLSHTIDFRGLKK